MTEDEIAEAEITPVTGLPDINPTDLVYSALGYFVKVRVLPVPDLPFGYAVFEVSSSQTDDQGRALEDAGQYRIAPASRMTVQPEMLTDIPAALSEARDASVRAALRAIAVHEAMASITPGS